MKNKNAIPHIIGLGAVALILISFSFTNILLTLLFCILFGRVALGYLGQRINA